MKYTARKNEHAAVKNAESFYDSSKFALYLAAALSFELPQMVIRHWMSREDDILRSSPYISLEQICDYFKRRHI